MTTKNWLNELGIQDQLDLKGCGRTLRFALLRYIQRHHDEYTFELLDNPLWYIEAWLEGSERPYTREEAQDWIDEAICEHPWSLHNLGKALDILLNSAHMDAGAAANCLNHVLEAYSCKAPIEEWGPEEAQYLLHDWKGYSALTNT